MHDNSTDRPRTDWTIFFSTMFVLVLVCVPLFLKPAASYGFINASYAWITRYLGIFYLWSAMGVLAFCIWIVCSRYGNIKLGKPDSKPEFSLYSWASMLFCAGVATGILYWGTIEWAEYYTAPPFGLEPGSAEAIRWAAVFGIFHWGPTGWAYYTVPALAIGHAYYCRGISRVRVSSACHAVLGAGTDGIVGKLFDICFMIGLLGAAGTSLGFGTPMIAAAISRIFGFDDSYFYILTVLIAFMCTCIFATSVYLGLDKGIRRLSDVNMSLMFVLLAYMIAVGPTWFYVQQAGSGLVTISTHFLKMHALSGPMDATHYKFARDWTIFYWAWWIAVGPFMGVFIAQISHGRTFRQIVLGTLILGSLGSALFYVVLGNYALNLQLTGTQDVVAIKSELGAATAIVSAIATLPMESVVMPFFCIISLVFLATSYDSASYALASSASQNLSTSQPPARWHRLFWAFTLAVLPTALLLGDSGGGSLRALQTTALVVSVPLYVIYAVMVISLVRAMRQDERDQIDRWN